MSKKPDYYSYWYNRKNAEALAPREIKAISLIKKGNGRLIDIGCGEGRFLMKVIKKYEGNCYGVDYSKKAIEICNRKGLRVKSCDIEKRIPFKNGFFDIAYCGEVIEHLYNPDKFLDEVNRILKKGGILIITTPNLCSFYNRIIMLFGIQPVFIETSTVSSFVGGSLLNKIRKNDHPVGHVRIFTCRAIKDILEMHGFEVKLIGGAEFEHFPKKFKFIDRIFSYFPGLSSEIIILAIKK